MPADILTGLIPHFSGRKGLYLLGTGLLNSSAWSLQPGLGPGSIIPCLAGVGITLGPLALPGESAVVQCFNGSGSWGGAPLPASVHSHRDEYLCT